jgi:two-component system, NtrC family, response regulator PilR
VRIVAATNRELEAAVEQGRFRDDLFYRLNVIRVEMPPLRERREDLPALIEHFFASFAASMGKPAPQLSPEALRRLLDHPFPGNIRELENVIEHAVALSSGGTIEEADLPQNLISGRVPSLDPVRPAPAPPPLPEKNPVEEMRSKGSNLDLELEDYEKRFINEALRLAGGVRKRAAELLGINYRSLRHRLAKYGYEDRAEP